MPAPLATPAELSTYLQREVDTATATQALSLASGKVRGYINRPILTDTWDETTVPEDARSVVLAVASRVINNPSDLRTRQETVGSLSETLTYATETIGVQLTEFDRADLKRFRTRYRSIEIKDPAEPAVIEW